MSAEEGRAGDVVEQRNRQGVSPIGREEGGRRMLHGRSVEAGRIGDVVGSEEPLSQEAATRRAVMIERREGHNLGRR